jgi:hypothetical protein
MKLLLFVVTLPSVCDLRSHPAVTVACCPQSSDWSVRGAWRVARGSWRRRGTRPNDVMLMLSLFMLFLSRSLKFHVSVSKSRVLCTIATQVWCQLSVGHVQWKELANRVALHPSPEPQMACDVTGDFH